MNLPVYITDVNAYLPDAVLRVEDAIAEGNYSKDRAHVDGFSSLRIETELSSPEMAFKAAEPLVSQEDRSNTNSLFFAHIHRHGYKHLWPVASYLQKRLKLANSTRVMSINHGCNGLFLAVSLAYDLISHGAPGNHIVIGADRFSESGFDRLNSDLGTLYGDCATAVRLSAEPKGYRIRFMGLETEAALEAMYRDPYAAPESPSDHDIKSPKKAFLSQHGRGEFNSLFVPALKRLRNRILETNQLDKQPAKYVVYPNVGAGLSAQLYDGAFSDLAHQDHWEFGRSVGHTGTSDQFLGFWDLHRKGALSCGDQVLLIGAGNGLSLSAILLEKVQCS